MPHATVSSAPIARGPGELEELADHGSGARGAARVDGQVVDLRPISSAIAARDLGRAVGLEVHARGPRRSGRAGGGRGSAARSGAGAGSRRTAAGSPSAPSPSSARPARSRGRRPRGAGRARGRTPRTSSPSCVGSERGSMRGPATTIMRSSGTRRFAAGNASITRRSRSAPTPEPPTVTMQTGSSVAVAELGAQRARGRAKSAGSKPVT